MKPIEITITVTENGSKDEIHSTFPMDVPVGRLANIIEACRDSIIHSAAKYFQRNHQFSETEKQEIAETLTLRQIADDANGD